MSIASTNTYQRDLDTAIAHVQGNEKLKHQRVLVTGSTGTIGSFIADLLIRLNLHHGYDIKLFLSGRNINRMRERFGEIPNITYVTFDINDSLSFDSPVDYVIHAAGNAHPASYSSYPVETTMGNLNSTFALLNLLRCHGGKRLVYVSSSEAYGQSQPGMESFTEDYAGHVDLLSPRSCYPLSKRATENLCISYQQEYGIESVIVRPCHTYGPQITSADNRAHVQFIRNALDGKDIVLKSAGLQLRSYNYVADCVSGLLSAMLVGKAGEAYNLANPQATITIADFARKIAEIANCKAVMETPNAQEMSQRSPFSNQVLSVAKLEQLGWTPAFSLEEGIRHTLAILWEFRES